MEIALKVKNLSGVTKAKKDNILIYDGKEWYVTTKEQLFKEYDERFSKKLNEASNKLKEFDEMIKENKQFKIEVASQLKEMSELIKKLYSK